MLHTCLVVSDPRADHSRNLEGLGWLPKIGHQPAVSNGSPTSVAALAFLGDERAPRIARSISSGARWPRSEVIDDVVGGILIAASMGSNWLCRHCTRRCRASIDVRGSRGKHASPLLGVVRRGYIQRPEGVEAHFRLLLLFCFWCVLAAVACNLLVLASELFNLRSGMSLVGWICGNFFGGRGCLYCVGSRGCGTCQRLRARGCAPTGRILWDGSRLGRQ